MNAPAVRYRTIAILLVTLASPVGAGEPAEWASPRDFTLLPDSTGLVNQLTGELVLSPDSLHYELPAIIFSVYYQLPYYRPQSFEDKRRTRKLVFFTPSPNDSAWAVVAGYPGNVEVIYRNASLEGWTLINWSIHSVALGLYWSPDSRYLLLCYDGAGLVAVLFEQTFNEEEPIKVRARWNEQNLPCGWPFEMRPHWSTEDSRVSIDCPAPGVAQSPRRDTTFVLTW